MDEPIWPLFDLEIQTPNLTLRYVNDDLALRLAELAAAGIHDAASTPFLMPWTDAESPNLERNAMQFYWRCRADTTPMSWNLNFAVLEGNTVVGTTDIGASNFGVLRQFMTGSWLGQEFQGRGIGKEVRLAMLTLGFRGFNAKLAQTAAWHDNPASLGVTRSLGYTEQGQSWQLRREQRDRHIDFQMPRDHFDTLDTSNIQLIGVDAVRTLLQINS